uniref:Uncharacterized protein n=1 Tax=Romanomermis culicivorax TaxID=13658 RepID=A0A915L371_ROMCU
MVASYRWKEAATITAAVAVVLAPPAHFATQGPPPGIRTDSALESMNLIDSLSITDTMWAIWSTNLAKKYPHLP